MNTSVSIEFASFSDYKIDYTHCLGKGVFGTVYRVVKRPESEKGFFSYLFPYIYDSMFPVRNNEPVGMTNLCVKVSKSAIRVFFENAPYALQSLFVSSEERATNAICRKHGISNVRFFKSNSYYAQFKTVVRGRSFSYYLHNEFFKKKDQFLLRRAFVCFLRAVANPYLVCEDLNQNNIMYDEVENRWEVVDGCVYEKDIGLQMEFDNIADLFGSCNLNVQADWRTQHVFAKLSEVARSPLPFTVEMDRELLNEIDPGTNVLAVYSKDDRHAPLG